MSEPLLVGAMRRAKPDAHVRIVEGSGTTVRTFLTEFDECIAERIAEALASPHECEGQRQISALVNLVAKTPPPSTVALLRAEAFEEAATYVEGADYLAGAAYDLRKKAEQCRAEALVGTVDKIVERTVIVGSDADGQQIVLEGVEPGEAAERLASWQMPGMAAPFHHDIHIAVERTTVQRIRSEVEVEDTCPACGEPRAVPGEGRYCGSCQDHEGHCINDHCMTCGSAT